VLADVIAKARGRLPGVASLALEAVKRIDAIFDIEREINGLSADERLIIRRSRVVPLVAGLGDWLRSERAKLSRHVEAAKAMDYILKRWASFTRFLDDGRICLTNNAAEREFAASRSTAGRGCSLVLMREAAGPPPSMH
jgi:transposase